MKIVQAQKTKDTEWQFKSEKIRLENPLILVFGDRFLLEDSSCYDDVSNLFPNAHIVMGSTSGEILNHQISENTVVLTAIEFENSNFIVKSKNLSDYAGDDEKLGSDLMAEFDTENLKHIFVISEGSSVNGSTLIKGIENIKPEQIGLSGGLCGDDARFEKTLCS